MAPVAAQQAFYEASAQIIPVLLLVLAVELVRYRSPGEPLWASYSFLVMVLGMIAGEVAALMALASNKDTLLIAWFTCLGIGLGCDAVLMRAGLLLRDNLRVERSQEIADRFELIVTIMSSVLLIAVTFGLLIAVA